MRIALRPLGARGTAPPLGPTFAFCLAALAEPLIAPLMAPLGAQAYTSTDLAGLRLRNIGPASMSGRVVDMDVVESNP